MSSSQHRDGPAAILAPKGFEEAVLYSGAEYAEVKTTSDGAVRQRLVIIPDEHERERRVAAADTPSSVRSLHQQKLDELRWARDQVLSDRRIRSCLQSHEAALWPSVNVLREVVSTVSFLKKHDDVPPDPQGALAMMRALRVLESEHSYPGVYTLREVPLEGTLELYNATEKTELVPGAPADMESSTGTLSNTIPSRLDRLTSSLTAPRPLLLDVSTSLTVSALDAVAERLTSASQAALLQHLGASTGTTMVSPAETRKQWADMIHTHRQSILANGAPLFLDVQEALRWFGLNEASLAALMHEAIAAGHQVHLRVGASATVIHLPHVRCVVRGARPGEAAVHSDEGDEPGTEGVHVLTCAATDGVLTGDQARLSALMTSHFTSPLLTSQPNAPTMTVSHAETVDPLTCIVEARVPDACVALNLFVIVHGSRVENGFHGHARTLAEMKRRRQSVLDELTEKARLDAFRKVPGGAGQRAAAPTAGGLPRDVRSRVHSAVVQALSETDRPLSKKEITQRPAFDSLRQLPSFDRTLADALAALAETVSRKYVLKQ